MRRMISSLFLLLLCTVCVRAEQPVLTKARQVHDLSPDQAERRLPVQLIATVTYYNDADHKLVVADSSGAVSVAINHPYPIHRGDLVAIDGVSARGPQTFVSADPKLKVIGRGSMISIPIQSYKELMAGKWDNQYGEITGVVRSALFENHKGRKVLELELVMPGGMVQVFVHDPHSLDPARLADAEVSVSGIIGGDTNAQEQLMHSTIYAADASDLKVLSEPRVRRSNLPLTDIDKVMQTHFVSDFSERVRVRGAVTFYRPGNSVVIQQEGRSLYAATRQTSPVPLGTIVDLVGFADAKGYSPALVQTEIIPSGESQVIAPIPVTFAQALSGSYSDSLVEISGKVLSQLHRDSSDTLLLTIDNHVITVVLQAREEAERLSDLPIGSLVSVVGICRITPVAAWGGSGTTPMLFRINMRSRNDLAFLGAPSWWTVAHLLLVIGGLVTLFCLSAFWVFILRREVAAQTAISRRTVRLERARSRILEMINSEVPLAMLLEELCASLETLIQGARCSCELARGSEDDAPAPVTPIGEPSALIQFNATLQDYKAQAIGILSIRNVNVGEWNAYDREVVEVHVELANLAINQRHLYEALSHTSNHDQLTGLPNRRLSDFHLDAALQQAAHSGVRVGVAYIDVDRFKQVNDQHGHKTGDLYLQQIASRLLSKTRSSDKLARVGGDEFLLVATAMHSLEDVEVYRARLESCFDHSFMFEGVRVSGSASIGIAVYPDHGVSAEELNRYADKDMYAVKDRRKKGQIHLVSSPAETNVFCAADLTAALEEDQFRLFYQPQFSSRGVLRGFEALLRLEDPILGLVSPDAFIDVAERNDVIMPLGAWVLRQALSDAVRWRLEEMNDVRMIVNVSARQVEHPDFATDVFAALAHAGLPASNLEIEITERVLVRDTIQAIHQLHRIHDGGVRVSIDDFGVDHACLSSLHRYPIDTLKIDRSFVSILHSEPKVLHIMAAIVSLGSTMQKRIVAEGVETAGDMTALLKLGDMDFQGFFFSRPEPFERLTPKLPAWQAGIHDGARYIH